MTANSPSRRFQFSLRLTFLLMTGVCVVASRRGWVNYQARIEEQSKALERRPAETPTAPWPPRTNNAVIENALTGKTESEILAIYGKPDDDRAGYSRLGLEPPQSLPREPIRTLIFNRMDGGTLRVWVRNLGAKWVCFESCWYEDGVQF